MTTSDLPAGYPESVALRSERLLLRTFRREDLDLEDLWPDFDEPVNRQYNPRRDGAEAKEKRFHDGLKVFDLKLAIFDGETHVGYVGLYQTSYDKREAWMGIQFAADKRGMGYCKEALTLLCEAFFHTWRMERMMLEVAMFNEGGIRCYERVGFVAIRRFWNPNAYQRRLDFENDPRLAPVKHYFRRGENGVEVEFLEMAATGETFTAC